MLELMFELMLLLRCRVIVNASVTIMIIVNDTSIFNDNVQCMSSVMTSVSVIITVANIIMFVIMIIIKVRVRSNVSGSVMVMIIIMIIISVSVSVIVMITVNVSVMVIVMMINIGRVMASVNVRASDIDIVRVDGIVMVSV